MVRLDSASRNSSPSSSFWLTIGSHDDAARHGKPIADETAEAVQKLSLHCSALGSIYRERRSREPPTSSGVDDNPHLPSTIPGHGNADAIKQISVGKRL